jgi:hypothetical protein
MTTRPRTGRAEGVVQVLILLAIGTCAAAASFTHVHNVAQAHGQPGWLAWADAVVLELMSIATGLEIRRRHRGRQRAGFVMWVLICAVSLSLAAQVVEAEPSIVGWLAAALPALGFLACVKIVLARTPDPNALPVQDGQDDTGFRPPTAPAASVLRHQTAPVVPVLPTSAVMPAGSTIQDGPRQPFDDTLTDRPVPADAEEGQDGADLTMDPLTAARTVATAHRARTGKDITRDELRAALRVSTDLATDLLRTVRAEARPTLVPVPDGTFSRVNGHSFGGDR